MMQYTDSFLMVNNTQTPVLIVSDSAPIEFPDPATIQRTQETDPTIIVTTWHTWGYLFHHYEQDGQHYYWFLVKDKQVEERENPVAAQQALTGTQLALAVSEQRYSAAMLHIATLEGVTAQ